MINLIRPAGSRAITTGLFVSVITWYPIFTASGTVKDPWEPFDLWSFRVFYLLLCVNIVFGLIRVCSGYSGKRFIELCLHSAAVVLLLSGMYMYLYRFAGTVSLAEGEAYRADPSVFSAMSKGPLSKIPNMDLIMGDMGTGDKGNIVTIILDGRTYGLPEEGLRINGYHVKVLYSGVAPLFSITDHSGKILEESYVKLHPYPSDGEDSFMFRQLPYEFFIGSASVKNIEGEEFTLNVRRGKLSLYSGVISFGKGIQVENIRVSISDMKKFSVLKVTYVPGWTVLTAGAAPFSIATGHGYEVP